NALGDGEADIQWETDGIGAPALDRQYSLKPEARSRVTRCAHYVKIVAHVYCEHRDVAGFAFGGAVFKPVLVRILHLLRDDMIVGHEYAVVCDRKTGTVKCLCGVRAKKTLDLD